MNGLTLDEDRGPVLIAIDTDVNENLQLVKDAVAERDNKGFFVIAPSGMPEQLVQEFGPRIVVPPTVPIVVIDAEQKAPVFMKQGQKTLEELEAAVEAAR